MDGQRPIGWWVRRLDELLEQVVEHAVADEGLTRRHWQVLDTLAADGEVAALASFGGVGEALDDLVARGWVTGTPAFPELTGPGRAGHGRLRARVAEMRRQVADGLTADEYAQTVAGLARMVANVERALGRDEERGTAAPTTAGTPRGSA